MNKELLAEVLGLNVIDYELSIENEEMYYGHKSHEISGFIKLHQLAHMYKVWALEKGFMIQSYTGVEHSNACILRVDAEKISTIDMKPSWFADNEAQAVFDACEWIYQSHKG